MIYSACFTGHRKIRGSYYNTANPTPEWAQLKQYLLGIVPQFIINGVGVFYSGMAIGVDTVAAEAVGSIRIQRPDVELIAAIPFPSQPSNWPQASKDNYFRILNDLCTQKHYVSEDPYEAWKMHARDKFMVDRSHYVIAVWDGREGGGTYITVKHALETGKQVFRVNPESLQGEWLGNST